MTEDFFKPEFHRLKTVEGFDLFNRKRHFFGSLKEFIEWHNEIKPHGSLDFERAETPSEAFRRKLRTEVFLGQAAKLFGREMKIKGGESNSGYRTLQFEM